MLLDVFTGLVFAFLLLSLFTSTVLEMISGWLSLRGVNLERALENMLSPYFRRKKLTIWQMAKIKFTSLFKSVLPEAVLDERTIMGTIGADGSRSVGGATSDTDMKKAMTEARAMLRPGVTMEAIMPSEATRSMMARGVEPEPALDRISLFADFIQHPLYKLLAQPEAARKPSYLSAQQFSLIMFDVLSNMAGGKREIPEIQAAVDKMKNTDLKKTLAYFIKESRDEAGLKVQLENWYNAVMARVTGWYKRYTQYWLLGLGFAVAMFFNANALLMYKNLSKNPESAKQAAALATEFVKNHSDAQVAKGEPRPATVVVPTPIDTSRQDSLNTLPAIPAPAEPAAPEKQAQEINQELFKLVKGELDGAQQPLGMGWNQGILVCDGDSLELRKLEMGRLAAKYANEGPKPMQEPIGLVSYILGRARLGWFAFWAGLIGWLITALAICLGAPFWFDLLKKLINIRNAGPNPDETNNSNNNNPSSPGGNGNMVMIDRPQG